MSETTTVYRTQVSGWKNPRHTFYEGDKKLGVLSMRRNSFGLVVAGDWKPEEGEILSFRREPGLLRPQFSVWTEAREWLGSSDRSQLFRRRFALWTGGKPYRLVPLTGFGRGWRLVASRTGESVRFVHGLLRRDATIQVLRKTELVLFAYFVGALALTESLLPTGQDDLAGLDTQALRPSGQG